MLIAFQDALALLTQFDRGVISIVLVSLQVSLTALVLGTLVGLPLGAWLATEQFRGKRALIITINTLMGVPTVIIGVLVYLVLSRSGPLGELGWLLYVQYFLCLMKSQRQYLKPMLLKPLRIKAT